MEVYDEFCGVWMSWEFAWDDEFKHWRNLWGFWERIVDERGRRRDRLITTSESIETLRLFIFFFFFFCSLSSVEEEGDFSSFQSGVFIT